MKTCNLREVPFRQVAREEDARDLPEVWAKPFFTKY